jgi:hypothetical protein
LISAVASQVELLPWLSGTEATIPHIPPPIKAKHGGRLMTKCTYCQAATELFDNGVAICLQCSQEREPKPNPRAAEQDIRTTLLEELVEATKRSNGAIREFEAVIDQFPSGLPHPNGAGKIKNASGKLSIARSELTTAHNRLSDYFGRGIVPEYTKKKAV